MNAPPPFCAATPGKRRKFPSPTAPPAAASTMPNFVDQLSRFLPKKETPYFAAWPYSDLS